MNRLFNAAWASPLFLLFVSAFLALCMWFYVDRVWAPSEIHMSDLYGRWYGARELLLHGRDPYGPEVSREIQVWLYGHAIEPSANMDENRFAYPLYVAFFLAPTVTRPFPEVARLFRWILPLAAMISVALWVAMLRWRCSRQWLGCLTLLSLGSFPVLETIYLQQPALVAATFLAGAGAALSSRRLGRAGILLAFASIKPQLVALLAPWLVLWAASEWRKRQALVWSFGTTMLLLLAGSEILLPGWMRQFLAGVVAYQNYTHNFSILRLLLGEVGSTLAGLALLVVLAVLSWKVRRAPTSSHEFMAVFCLVLLVTVVIMPTIYPTNQVVLLPAIFFPMQHIKWAWTQGRPARLALFASLSLIAWPWLGTLILMFLAAFKPMEQIRRLWALPLIPVLLVPLSLLILFAILTPALLDATTADRQADCMVGAEG